jgi:acyl-CoA synthetase (NDP forming)
VRFFFNPAGCAIVGASRDPAKPGHQMLRSFLDAGFPPERLFPVNPNEREIAGLLAYPSLADIPDPVETAVLMVGPKVVEAVAAEAGARARAKGDLKGLIVTAGGYAELGTDEGRRRQENLVKTVSAAGIRLIGPNCVGIIDTFSRVDTTFLHGVVRRRGPISFVSQSGAVGAWLLQMLSSEPEPIGFSKFLSLGNMADVTMGEALDFLREDSTTGVVGLYLEGVPSPRPLLQALAALARDKPVIVLKTGRTESGRAAATSHTGALAGADRIWDGALRQAGALRADGMEEFVDTLRVLADTLPLASPREAAAAPGERESSADGGGRRRVFLVTHAGGPGVYTMDLLAAHQDHLATAQVRTETRAALMAAVPPLSSVCRPEGHIDMTASATAQQHAEVVRILLGDPGVDALVTLDLPIRFLGEEEIARALAGAWTGAKVTGKLFLPLLMHGKWSEEGRRILAQAGLPALGGPDRAVAVLVNLARLAHLRHHSGRDDFVLPEGAAGFDLAPADHGAIGDRRAPGPAPGYGVPSDPGASGMVLNEVESATCLAAAGVSFPPSRLVRTKDEAVLAAGGIGYPVVVKLCSRLIPHKALAGGVRLDLRSEEQVARAWDELAAAAASILGDPAGAILPPGLDGFLIQAQTPPGVEVIVGGLRDPVFGPVVAVGPGGTRVDRGATLSFRLAPLSEATALRLAEETVAACAGQANATPGPGLPAGDSPAAGSQAVADLARAIAGLSRLMAYRPEVVEADLNPIIVLPGGRGAVAVDALVRLA